VADVVGGKLDPAQYLRRGRHEEWTLAMSGAPQCSVTVDDWWPFGNDHINLQSA